MDTNSKKAATSKIWVTFQRPGFHRYPNAPTDVSYLATEHRHLFKFKVTVEVFTNDRDVEFHQLLNWLEARYPHSGSRVDHKSCEMLAEELIEALSDLHGTRRRYEVEVSEDGECGAIVSQFT